MTREKLCAHVAKVYKIQPDVPWSDGDSPVFRHPENRKWFGLVLRVPRAKLGLSGTGSVDVLNVKCDPLLSGSYRQEEGIFPAYHMNHEQWLSVLLDGTVPVETVFELLDVSFTLTAPKARRTTIHGRAAWLVPANPKFYDIAAAFRERKIIEWKQSSRVRAGDDVYLYVAAPVSAVLYHCRAVETDIPYRYADENVRMEKVMRIELLREYPPDRFSFAVLQRHGVRAVRGPRSVPEMLRDALEENS